MHSYERINEIDEVAEVVQDHPSDGDEIVKLPEHSPANHHDSVVEDGHVNNPQPLQIIFQSLHFKKWLILTL